MILKHELKNMMSSVLCPLGMRRRRDGGRGQNRQRGPSKLRNSLNKVKEVGIPTQGIMENAVG